MKRAIFTILSTVSLLYASAQTDSIPANKEVKEEAGTENREIKETTLQELVVESDYAWFEGDKAVFVPRKNEKNLATDAMSLVANMHIPVLNYQDGGITSKSGGPVSIFINGVAADEIDLSTFWPKNALRVEYYENPSDPKFMGKSNVLNFIMKDYEFGGLTKIHGRQQFPNNGKYDLSSKFVYKRMTYNALFSGGYSRDHLSGSFERETFRDVWYGGNFYDKIERTSDSDDNDRRNDNIYAGFNARYLNGSTRITHTVSLQWNRNPESTGYGETSFTPALFDGNTLRQLSRSRSLSPSATGSYQFQLNPKWFFSTFWRFSHSHNNSFSGIREGDTPEIVNRFRENTYSGRVAFNLAYSPIRNMQLVLAAAEQRNIYSAQYSGSTDSHQWQHYGETLMLLHWWYQMNDHLTMSFKPQFTLFDRNTDHRYKTTEFLPGARLHFNYNINSKNNLMFILGYHVNPPQANVTNDVIIRESELTWIKGNPNIRTNDQFNLVLTYATYPSSFIDMSFNSYWYFDRNEQMFRYFSGGKDYDGIIKQYSNAGNHGEFLFRYDLGGWLIRNKLRLTGTMFYQYDYYTGGLHKSQANFRYYAGISWDFGNCSLWAHYRSKRKGLANGGTEVISSPDELFLSFSYGNGNFYLNVLLNYPFGKHSVYESWLRDNNYSLNRSNWNIGRNVSVSLTYTFDYGKKITPGIDISEENIINSSKL